MLFLRCRSVHTFGMNFAIVAVSLDGRFTVLDVRTLPPNRFLAPHRRTRHIAECAFDVSIDVGDRFVAQRWSEV